MNLDPASVALWSFLVCLLDLRPAAGLFTSPQASSCPSLKSLTSSQAPRLRKSIMSRCYRPALTFAASLRSRPLTKLAPILFPFFRHAIANVRLAVVNTFVNFLFVPALTGEWISQPFVRLLFQNLVVEERADIREVTMKAWREAVASLVRLGRLQGTVVEVLLPWFSVLMNPIGTPLDQNLFYQPLKGGTQLHNVDKPMLMQDTTLISEDAIMRGRVTGCKALACILAAWPIEVCLLRACLG